MHVVWTREMVVRSERAVFAENYCTNVHFDHMAARALLMQLQLEINSSQPLLPPPVVAYLRLLRAL